MENLELDLRSSCNKDVFYANSAYAATSLIDSTTIFNGLFLKDPSKNNLILIFFLFPEKKKASNFTTPLCYLEVIAFKQREILSAYILFSLHILCLGTIFSLYTISSSSPFKAYLTGKQA